MTDDPGQQRLDRLKSLVDGGEPSMLSKPNKKKKTSRKAKTVAAPKAESGSTGQGPAQMMGGVSSHSGATSQNQAPLGQASQTSAASDHTNHQTDHHTGEGARAPGQGLTILGLLFTVGILGAAAWQVGEESAVLWNPLGMVIVLGGTAAATLLSFRPAQIRMIFQVHHIFFHRDEDVEGHIDDMMRVIRVHARSGVRAAEKELNTVSSDFLKLGMQLALDGTPLDDLVHAMNWRLQRLQERDFADARLFRTMALFAPAFGMFGTVAGLIGMLQELASRDLTLIGSSMAVAMVTTFYGLCLGYLLFRPLAIRLEQMSERRIARLNVLVQGVLLFRLGRTPGTVEDSVRTLLTSYQEAEGGKSAKG